MRVSPDGQRYIAVGTGARVAVPFHLRWLVPFVCGASALRWLVSTLGALAGLLVCSAWFVSLCGASGWKVWAAPLLVLGLPGVVKINLRYPVLVDAPAMFLAILAACLSLVGWWPAAIAVVLVAGMVKETSPLFAALFAWNPLLLVGLVAPLVRWLVRRPGSDVLDAHNRWVLEHPFRASWSYHKDRLQDVTLWVAPWGVLLVGLVAVNVQLVVTLCVAYLLVVVATDTVRIYQWAFPVLLVAALTVIPDELLVVAVVAHLFSPWAGDGL